MAQLPDPALDVRIAFRLLELLLHLLQRHLLPLEPLPVLEEIIGDRDQREHRHHRAQQIAASGPWSAEQGRRIEPHHRIEPMRSGQSTAVITAPSAITLNRPLTKFAAACLPNIRLAPASGEILLNFGFSASADQTKRCWMTLPAIAADHQHQNGTPSAAISMYSRFCDQRQQAGAVGADLPGIGDQIAQRHLDAAADRARKRRQHQRRAGDHEPGVDLLALGDVAAFERIVEAFLGRVFCFLGIVVSSAIASALSQRRQFVHDADEVIEEGPHHRRSTAARIRKPAKIDSGTPTK